MESRFERDVVDVGLAILGAGGRVAPLLFRGFVGVWWLLCSECGRLRFWRGFLLLALGSWSERDECGGELLARDLWMIWADGVDSDTSGNTGKGYFEEERWVLMKNSCCDRG